MYYQEPTFWTAFLLFPESPLLKHCQEPGVGFLTATPYGPLQVASFAALHYWEIPPSQGNVVFSQLFTNMACKRTVWLFQQQWDCIFLYILFLACRDRSRKFLPTREKLWNFVPVGSSYIAWWTVLFFYFFLIFFIQLQLYSFSVSPMDEASFPPWEYTSYANPSHRRLPTSILPVQYSFQPSTHTYTLILPPTTLLAAPVLVQQEPRFSLLFSL